MFATLNRQNLYASTTASTAPRRPRPGAAHGETHRHARRRTDVPLGRDARPPCAVTRKRASMNMGWFSTATSSISRVTVSRTSSTPAARARAPASSASAEHPARQRRIAVGKALRPACRCATKAPGPPDVTVPCATIATCPTTAPIALATSACSGTPSARPAFRPPHRNKPAPTPPARSPAAQRQRGRHHAPVPVQPRARNSMPCQYGGRHTPVAPRPRQKAASSRQSTVCAVTYPRSAAPSARSAGAIGSPRPLRRRPNRTIAFSAAALSQTSTAPAHGRHPTA